MKALSIAVLTITLTSPLAVAGHFEGHVDVTVGELSSRAQAGQAVFNQHCSVCHGVDGAGTRLGPPLIHAIYNPGHHDNKSFARAVTQGVQQHHWPYGNMPAQPQVGFSDLSKIMAFIREVQKQNGIETRKHRM